jgi:hypothetical protein
MPFGMVVVLEVCCGSSIGPGRGKASTGERLRPGKLSSCVSAIRSSSYRLKRQTLALLLPLFATRRPHHHPLVEHKPGGQLLRQRDEIHIEELNELLVLKARLDTARQIPVLCANDHE